MPLKELREEIEMEFDENWNTCCWSEKDGLHQEAFLSKGSEDGEEDSYDEMKIKNFLFSALDRQLSAFRQMVEEMKKTTKDLDIMRENDPDALSMYIRENTGWNLALNDLLAKLNNEDGK